MRGINVFFIMFDEPYTNIIHICLWLNANNVNGSYFIVAVGFQFTAFLTISLSFQWNKITFFFYIHSNQIELKLDFWVFSLRKDFLCFYALFGFSIITKRPKREEIKICEAWIGIIQIFLNDVSRINGNWSNCDRTDKPTQFHWPFGPSNCI